MIQPEADEQILKDSIDVTFGSKSVQTYLTPTYSYKNQKYAPFREIRLVGLSDVRMENRDLFLTDYTPEKESIFGKIFKSKSLNPVFTSVQIYSDLNPYNHCLEAESLGSLENEMPLEWREEHKEKIELLE